MFFVYGTSGQMFRGSMEQLRQIQGVGASARPRRVAAIGRDGQEAAQESEAAFLPPDRHTGSSTKDEAGRPVPLMAYVENQLGPIQRHPLTQVADVMSHRAITLSDQSTVQDALTLLIQNAIGQAPVVDGKGQLVGLVTRADLFPPSQNPGIENQAKAWQTLMAQKVSSIMLTPVPSVALNGSIRRVARVLLDTGLPGLPVVDEQGLVNGFISRVDILRAVVNDPPLDLWG